ncbi:MULTISPECIES: sugar phosphate nucleotidyltransferase [Corynebacterium]|uniref:sugar phosphate nucleotidyltransferase n=1 Tax=Corynebacterium TaxID=1716 RepID=UPI000BAA45AA|nr:MULTISPECIES: NDP-sugar synthase [Corynebacterium]PAT04543.1 GDP-mannose pyrophosphorylase [Corynebacterium sp. NML 150383]PAT12941.1 GDP-mannose pyrophosphorylase [Corynebacterium hadale]PAT15537.1 GDP-mannose pyrophosphorylase [Corynebacterium sp. NML 120412]TVX77055.1 NDP-sugar synthase [Corynebacterium sp. NML180780]WJZ14833.1 D-glycero-alpha-D-manno-heptose 1-phosphate guanylyltransferase [Corynebacterium gottingense]
MVENVVAHPERTDAVILVGGRGTRLRPLTVGTPKPMLPTAGHPFLSHLLARIKEAGMHHVVLGTSYKAEVFEEYFGDGSDFGLEIEYVVEEEALGTGGAIRNVADKLRYDNAMVFNGDVLSGADLSAILGTHVEHDADVTLHLVRVPDPRAFGSVPTDKDGNVQAFLEKTEDPPTDQINAGCYVFKRSVIEQIPAGRVVSVERETFPGLLESGAKVVGHVDSSYWRDMGRPHDFVEGSSDVVRGIAYSPLLAGKTGESFVDESAGVSGGVILIGGTAVGRGSVIGAGSRVDASVIFDGVTIEPGAVVRNSIIASGARIGANARISDCVIGEGVEIGARCELQAGMRIWPGVSIPDSGVRFSPDA